MQPSVVPWLFNQGEKQLTIDDKIDILEEMLRINVERIDEHRGILHTRRHLAASPIFKGIPDLKKTRNRYVAHNKDG